MRNIQNQEIWLRIHDEEGVPLGMTIAVGASFDPRDGDILKIGGRRYLLVCCKEESFAGGDLHQVVDIKRIAWN